MNIVGRSFAREAFVQALSAEAFVRAMLDFERALAAAERTKNFDALVGGVAGTLKQMQAFLKKAEGFLDGAADFGFWREILVR